MTYAIPIEANRRLADLVDERSSNEVRATTARWFAEMIIERFLSDSIRERFSLEQFEKLTLGNRIKGIEADFDSGLIQALRKLKKIGDDAVHYKKGRNLDDDTTIEAINTALQLFNLVLIDEFIKNPLNATENRDTLFSILMPSVREHVLLELLYKAENRSEYFEFLVHKYVLACVKNKNQRTASLFLDDQLKKQNIDENQHEFEQKTITKIQSGIDQQLLPIAQDLRDARRNFNHVLASFSNEEKAQNVRLISIIDRLLEEVTPSEIGAYIENARFKV